MHEVILISLQMTRKQWYYMVKLVLKFYFNILKYKAVPLQAWNGPDGSKRKLMFQDFTTTAQDGRTFVSLTHLPPLPPGNTPGTHFC